MAEGNSSRPVSVGFSRFMECSLCLDKLKNHRTLPCLHMFCHDCLVPLVVARTISCPLCRKVSMLSARGVADLPKNPVLVEVLERVCQSCQERNKESQCKHCDKWLCGTCLEVCKLHVEIHGMITARQEKLNEIRKAKVKRHLRKDEQCSKVEEDVEKIRVAVFAAEDEIRQGFENELRQQTAPLEALLGKISEEVRTLESFIDKSDKERVTATKASVQQILEECRTSVTNTAINRVIPSDTAQYNHNNDLIQKIKEAITKPEVQPTVVNSAQPSVVRSQPFSPLVVQPKSVNYQSSNIHYEILGRGSAGNNRITRPTHLALSSVTGNMVVTSTYKNKIDVFGHVGGRHQFLRELGTKGNAPDLFHFGKDAGCGGIDFTSKGLIVVSDTENHRIQILTEHDDIIRVIGSKGGGASQFRYPTGLAVHGDQIHVSDHDNHRIQVLNEDGTLIRQFYLQDGSGICWPQDLTICKNGDMIVAATGNNSGKLMVFTKEGRHKQNIAIHTRESRLVVLKHPYGVTLDAAENVIVTDFSTHQVHIITQSGQLLRTFGSRGNKAGQFNGPVGVVCAKDGSIIIADCNNERVQVVTFE